MLEGYHFFILHRRSGLDNNDYLCNGARHKSGAPPVMTNDTERTYIAIDLKSFYASVECVERGIDPLKACLVVADAERTDKTICLAVSPALKAYGISGRARLFEVRRRVDEVNAERRRTGRTDMLTFIIAEPRMALYIAYSHRVHDIYRRHVSPEDMHIYSIDEVFIDATQYIRMYKTTARGLAMTMIRDVLASTGITATAGIGPNLFIAKVAMDIVAKHIPADADGVRTAELDVADYRRRLWSHRPLTDFWRVGGGTMRRLAMYGIHTMGDIARRSLTDEDLLYSLFGVNAELLVDHAWGYEPCTIAMIKAYRPDSSSMSSGQVLASPYTWRKAQIIVREMADRMALDLLERRQMTQRLTLTVGYDASNMTDAAISRNYNGPVATDRYGRRVPAHAHGTAAMKRYTSSSRLITEAAMSIFLRVADKRLLVRRINITACDVIDEHEARRRNNNIPVQLDLFDDSSLTVARQHDEEERLSKERRMQETLLEIKRRYGKNAVLKAISYDDDATARQRNTQIGGHKA